MAITGKSVTPKSVTKIEAGFRYFFQLIVTDDLGPGVDRVFSRDHNEANDPEVALNAIKQEMQTAIDIYKAEQGRLNSTQFQQAATYLENNLTV